MVPNTFCNKPHNIGSHIQELQQRAICRGENKRKSKEQKKSKKEQKRTEREKEKKEREEEEEEDLLVAMP